MVSKSKVYIYALVNPLNSMIFYVGKSKNLNSRMSGHRRMYNQTTALESYIEELSIKDEYPEYKILDEIYSIKYLCNELEKCWIGKLLREGHDLLNVHHRLYQYMNPVNKIKWIHQIEAVARSKSEAVALLDDKEFPGGIVKLPSFGIDQF